MSFYEITAEQKNYFLFEERTLIKTPAHFHGAMEIHFVEEGSLDIILDGERRTLHAGDACFFDSFTLHAIPKPEAAKSYYLVGSKEVFDSTFSLFEGKTPPRFFRFDDFPLLRFLMEICNQSTKNDEGRYATFTGSVRILLGKIFQNTPFVPRSLDGKNTFICNLLNYAEENPQEDLSLFALSKKFGYSREHLSRILHKYLLENWNTYINRLRVRKAERLLSQNPESNVLEIAYACGFDNPTTFYRAYNKEFGKPPRK